LFTSVPSPTTAASDMVNAFFRFEMEQWVNYSILNLKSVEARETKLSVFASEGKNPLL
jgi:hypothetical protein